MNTDAFRGDVVLRDAWRGRDFSGQRVAIIATGRDAAAIVPSVVSTAARVKLFLDQPSWIAPELPGAVTSIVRALGRMTGRRAALEEGLARLHLFARVRDPWQRRLLAPHPRFGDPDVAVGRGFYRALAQPHCTVVHWPVYAIVEQGVRSAEGIEHRVDCIVAPDPEGFAVGARPQPAPKQGRTA